MRNLSDILGDLSDSSESSKNFFGKTIDSIEKSIWAVIESFLRDNSDNGKLKSGKSSENLLIEVDKKVKKSWLDSGIRVTAKDYFQEFDIVEKLTKEFYRSSLKGEDQPGITKLFRDSRVFKTKIIDDLTSALINPDVFSQGVTNELRDILFEGIAFGQGVDEVEKILKEKILTTKGNTSLISRYTRQISQDAISQYEGTLNDRVRVQFDLNGFAYTGSIIETSRVNCVNMTCTKRHEKFHGKFDDYKLPGVRGFRVEDIDEIITLAGLDNYPNSDFKGNEAFNFTVTSETFAKIRMGYGCRHTIIFFDIEEDEPTNKEIRELLEG